jgi:hypothetical protein
MTIFLMAFGNNTELYLLPESIFRLIGIPLVVTMLVTLIHFKELPFLPLYTALDFDSLEPLMSLIKVAD